MAFQFQCPQGHLLEGDESQAGQQCHCPICGMLFIIPAPLVPAAAGGGRFAHFEQLAAAATPAVEAAPTVAATPTPPTEPEVLHILCPNGHELETPIEMLDHDVLCPTCQVQFRLRRRDSIEFKRKKELEEKLRLEKIGNLWLNGAIAAVVIVVLGLIALVMASQMNQPVSGPP